MPFFSILTDIFFHWSLSDSPRNRRFLQILKMLRSAILLFFFLRALGALITIGITFMHQFFQLPGNIKEFVQLSLHSMVH